MSNERDAQLAVCERYRMGYVAAPGNLKVGISRSACEGGLPINGLRHPPTADTSGWYIWAGGEPSDDPDFFMPLHIEHLGERCPAVIRFLGLPPGSRFLVAGDHEDVWEDGTLLDV